MSEFSAIFRLCFPLYHFYNKKALQASEMTWIAEIGWPS